MRTSVTISAIKDSVFFKSERRWEGGARADWTKRNVQATRSRSLRHVLDQYRPIKSADLRLPRRNIENRKPPANQSLERAKLIVGRADSSWLYRATCAMGVHVIVNEPVVVGSGAYTGAGWLWFSTCVLKVEYSRTRWT